MAVPTGEKKGHFGNSYPQHLGHSETFLGLSEGQRDDLAMLGTGKNNIIFILNNACNAMYLNASLVGI